MLRIKLFAGARQLVGDPEIELPWADGETVATLKRTLSDLYPNLRPMLPRLLVAINNDYASDRVTIQSEDEVACFPPVSGG